MCVSLRYEVFSLSEDLEIEMRYLETQGIFLEGKSWVWMKMELDKARKEVNMAIGDGNAFEFVTKASLHEVMILAIMRNCLSNTDPVWDMPDK